MAERNDTSKARCDQAVLEHRLDKARLGIYSALAVVRNARAAVCQADGGDGSDTDFALGVACKMLDELTLDLDSGVLFAPAEAPEVRV